MLVGLALFVPIAVWGDLLVGAIVGLAFAVLLRGGLALGFRDLDGLEREDPPR